MADFFLNQLIFSQPIITWLFFIASYAILGGGIKYIDDAFDEKTFSKISALLFMPLLAVFGAVVMTLSAESATILGAIVVAVFLKGKIDTIAFKIGLISLIAILFFMGFFNFLWIPLIIIAIAGVLDEVGNDYVDKHLNVRKPIRLFFEFRFVMKLAVLYFAAVGTFAWFYFFAFIAFDIAYALVMEYSMSLAHKKKFAYYKNHNGFLDKAV